MSILDYLPNHSCKPVQSSLDPRSISSKGNALIDKVVDVIMEETPVQPEVTQEVPVHYVIAPIPPTLITVLWDRVEGHLARVVEVSNGEISLQSIKESCLLGKAMLLAVCRDDQIVAVITVEKRTFESGKSALFLPIVGGDELDGWLDQVLEVAILIAKDLDCEVIRGLGARKGWIRKLKDKGWKEAYSVLEVKVE
jgi:hypothetical protein